MKENYDIDAVILWVDGNDTEWQKERDKYIVDKTQDYRVNRYRDWENLQYIFRGIEKFAPWVRKVFFVTCGHFPQWLNLNCEKLVFVKHSDFIPKQYLPTFSSQAIDLNLHRIPGLSEHFIYFNDDMFLTDYVKPSDFFKNGLPRDVFSERPIFAGNGVFSHNILNIFEILNRHFKRKEILRKNIGKILAPQYGRLFFYNLLWYFYPYKKFCALYNNHLPMGYRKSTFEKVWSMENEILTQTVSNKFRSVTDVNQFIFNYWELLTGEFVPTNMDRQGKLYLIKDRDNEKLYKAICCQKHKRICINDECSEVVYAETKENLKQCFEKILPGKCSYER